MGSFSLASSWRGEEKDSTLREEKEKEEEEEDRAKYLHYIEKKHLLTMLWVHTVPVTIDGSFGNNGPFSLLSSVTSITHLGHNNEERN